MKQEFSIIKIATGIVATAAVVAIAAGSAVLIHSMNNKPAIQPGASGSSAESSADTTTPAVTTETTAVSEDSAVTTMSTAAQPAKGSNFLGGEGAIVPVGVSGQAGSVIAHDDTYWYANYCRMTADSNSEQLSGEAHRWFDSLMSDGKQLYSVNANSLFTVDANGVTTPFYTYEGYSTVTYSIIANIGNCMAPDFATKDPWYYIGGYAGNGNDTDKFGVFFQPATGKQMNVEKLFDKTGETFYAPNEVRVCGNSVYALIGDGCTVSAIPHPDALMSDRAQLDWAQQYYELEVGGDGYVADWRVDYDTISYFCYGTYTDAPCCACRLWMQDGAFEKKEIDIVPEGETIEHLMNSRVMYANGKLLTFSMIDETVSGEPTALIVTEYSANGVGEAESELQLVPHENAVWAGQSGDGATIVCYYYRINGNYCMETAWCME